MEFSQAQQTDLPEIIALLKKSLGESLLPKSEAYFIWKHVKNPFGQSKILLAKGGNQIIGVRAFMQWRWVNATDTITAVRAVDTATDPLHQGKGIFSQLTKKMVEECKSEGVGFVFNTPNSISMPGYLKLGWYAIGRMPLYIGPGSMAPRLFSEKAMEKIYAGYSTKDVFQKLNKDWSVSPAPMMMHTPVNYAYLNWRYNECPVAVYGAVIEPGQFGFIFRLKKVNRFIELRICELWTENSAADKLAKKAIKKLIRATRPVLVTCAPSPLFETSKKRILGLFGPMKKGPVVTLRPLAIDKLNIFNEFTKWNPSIGSMELF